MIVNGTKLLDAAPLGPMETSKIRCEASGTSYGLSEGGYDVRLKQSITLHPFRLFALASTFERFTMPDNLIGIVHDKSSLIRKGLMVGNSVIEPGWNGWLTIELFYFGWRPLRLTAGMGIAQVLFSELKEPAKYRGIYQNQDDKPIQSKAYGV